MIIIPTYFTKDTGWLLTQCLNSLAKVESEDILSSVFVIDDGSPHPGRDEGYAELQTLFPKVKLYLKNENKGYADSINIGFKWAQKLQAKFVITLNPDVEMITPFIKRVVEIFRIDPLIAVVGCRLLFPNGQIQHAGFDVIENHDFFVAATLYDRNNYVLSDPGESGYSRYMMGVTGAFQAIRMRAVEECGGYSEDYFLAYEDVEFCVRMWSQGYRVFYDADIEGVHLEGATRGKGVSATELRSMKQVAKDLLKHDLPAVRSRINEFNTLLAESVGVKSGFAKR